MAQSSFTAKYYGLTVHPFGDPTAHLQPRKLDKNAVFVLNHGLFVGYERFVYKELVSVKFIQGFLQDCSKGFASVTHLGVRATLYQTDKHRFIFGIGPTLIARESWSRFGKQYISSNFFNEHEHPKFGPIQWRFITYGIDLEYDYCISEKNNISISLTPGFPLANIVSVGWKHWITPLTKDPILF